MHTFRRSLLALFVVLAFAGLGRTEDLWTKHPGDGWTNILDGRAFKGKLYVIAYDAGNLKIMASADGNNWTVASGLPNRIYHMAEHQGVLYAFTQLVASDPLSGKIYRTVDGISWQPVNAINHSKIDAALVYQDNLIMGGRDGIYRGVVSNQGDAIALTPLPQPIVGNPKFAVFNNELYMSIHDWTSPTMTLYRLKANNTWEQLAVLTSNITAVTESNFVEHNGVLYISFGDLYKTTGGPSPIWAKDPSTPSGFFPFKVGMELYAKKVTFGGLLFQILSMHKRMPDGTWQERSAPDNGISCADDSIPLGDATYIACREVWGLKHGVTSTSYQSFVPSPLIPGESNLVALSFSFEVSANESLRRLVVSNVGTAEGETDIARMKIMRSVGQAPLSIENLVYDRATRTWSTPSSFSYPITDDDIFYLAVDVAAGAREGKTVQLVIQPGGMSFEESQTFALAFPILAATSQSIKASLAAVPDILVEPLVYPQPARDTARFGYDLSGPADIIIKIFDRNGVLVSEINDPGKLAGRGTTIWDATQMASGTYYATIRIKPASGGEQVFKKKVFIKK